MIKPREVLSFSNFVTFNEVHEVSKTVFAEYKEIIPEIVSPNLSKFHPEYKQTFSQSAKTEYCVWHPVCPASVSIRTGK